MTSLEASDGAETQPLRTILLGTDFSETADVALSRACELARGLEARLIVGHSMTLHPRPAGGPRLMEVSLELEARLREASIEALEALVESAGRQGVEAAAELTEGPPALSLARLAEERQAELIVVGTRGMTGFAHLLLGSTAEQLIQQAPCPVLSIHRGDGTRLDRLRRVLVPIDYSEEAELAATTVADLLAERRASIEITLVHAYHLPAGVSQLLGYYPVEAAVDEAGRAASEALAPMADMLRRRGFAVEVVAANGYPPDVITSLVESLGVDLIAMGTRGLSGLPGALRGSTAKRVIQYARCPVLTVGR